MEMYHCKYSEHVTRIKIIRDYFRKAMDMDRIQTFDSAEEIWANHYIAKNRTDSACDLRGYPINCLAALYCSVFSKAKVDHVINKIDLGYQTSKKNRINERF